VGPRKAHYVVNPRMLELEVAKEILSELFDIRTHEVDEMIRQRMEERTLYGQEFNLSSALTIANKSTLHPFWQFFDMDTVHESFCTILPR
jgi:hypothetical protein